MHKLAWLRLTFLAAAELQIATIFLDYRLVPYSGTIAVSALLAMALSGQTPSPTHRRWTHHTAIAGLTLLTGAAFLADHRTGGYGWSTEIAGGDSDASRFGLSGSAVEAVLVVAAASALAAAVLGRVERLLRWQHIPGLLMGLLFVAAAAGIALDPLTLSDQIPPDLRLRLLVLMPVALVVAALLLAANAALSSRGRLRPAGAGLLAVVALALTSFYCLDKIEPLQSHADPVAQGLHPDETISYLNLRTLTATSDYRNRDLAAVTALRTPPATGTDELEAGHFWKLPPPTAVEAWRQALAADPHRQSAVVAVPYLPPWTGREFDWSRDWPAIKAALIAAGLVALVMSLFEPTDGLGSALNRGPRRFG